MRRFVVRLSIAASLALWPVLAQAISLAGTEWKPLRMGDMPVPDNTSAYIQFRSKGRLTGFSGCNRLMAEYAVDGDTIFIGPVGATRKMCADSVMLREAALATALEQARTFRRQTTELVLFDAAGLPILEMRQTDWD